MPIQTALVTKSIVTTVTSYPFLFFSFCLSEVFSSMTGDDFGVAFVMTPRNTTSNLYTLCFHNFTFGVAFFDVRLQSFLSLQHRPTLTADLPVHPFPIAIIFVSKKEDVMIQGPLGYQMFYLFKWCFSLKRFPQTHRYRRSEGVSSSSLASSCPTTENDNNSLKNNGAGQSKAHRINEKRMLLLIIIFS